MSADVWMTRQEVSDREKIPVATLAQWAHKGRGPKYALFGRHARYRLADVIAWENAQFGDGDAAAESAVDGVGQAIATGPFRSTTKNTHQAPPPKV